MSATRELRDLAELLARERAARSALEDEKRIRARLFATMAEQLLTHANAIDGWTDLLRRSTLDAHGREVALEHIAAAARAQRSMLEDLALTAMLDGDVRVADLKRIDLFKLVCAVAGDLGEQIVVEGSPTAHVVANAEHLVRVLRALFERAKNGPSPTTVSVSEVDPHAEVRIGIDLRDRSDELRFAVALRASTPA